MRCRAKQGSRTEPHTKPCAASARSSGGAAEATAGNVCVAGCNGAACAAEPCAAQSKAGGRRKQLLTAHVLPAAARPHERRAEAVAPSHAPLVRAAPAAGGAADATADDAHVACAAERSKAVALSHDLLMFKQRVVDGAGAASAEDAPIAGRREAACGLYCGCSGLRSTIDGPFD